MLIRLVFVNTHFTDSAVTDILHCCLSVVAMFDLQDLPGENYDFAIINAWSCLVNDSASEIPCRCMKSLGGRR